MSYMSYCKYEGALHELRRCLYEVREHMDDEAEDAVSRSEINAFRSIIKEFYMFVDDFELINPITGELDEDVLDEICFKMEQYDDPDEE